LSKRSFVHVIALLLVVSAGALPPSSAQAQSYSRQGPWWAKVPRPLLSMAYTPEPADYSPGCTEPFRCKYFDTDFYNSDFSLLWGAGGRNDLGTLNSIHANNIHLYDWSSCRDHIPFLNYAQQNGLTVMVPFSNYNVDNPYDPERTKNIQAIVREVYGLDERNNGRKTPHPAVVMWALGNEYDYWHLPPANVAHIARIIVDLENSAGIPENQRLIFTASVSFGVVAGRPPAIEQIEALQRAFVAAGLSDVWYNRFLAGINTTNDGAFMDNYIQHTFPAQGDFAKGDGLPLFLNEYGQNGQNACALLHRDKIEACAEPQNQALRDTSQNEYNAAEFRVGITLSTAPAKSSTGYFYGFSVFQWQDAFWKCPGTICTESQFGITKRGSQINEGTIAGGRCGIPANTFKYPVVNLEQKPAWQSTVEAFSR
jgi:hypothetical protein